MKNTKFFPALIAALMLTTMSFAQSVIKPVSGTAYAKLSSATRARMINSDGTRPVEYKIRIVWKSNTPPESFFFHPKEGGWWNANAQVVKKGQLINVDFKDIKKGDVLEVSPMPGGRYAEPFTITKSMDNYLFFMTGNNKWIYVPVKNIKLLNTR